MTGKKTVLVVDDQADERLIQTAMLGHLGYEVREAGDGEAGVRDALDRPPDLILLDVAMPRVDGFTVCRTLRSDPRTSEVPILLFTASAAGDLPRRAREAGATGLLSKPLDPRDVASEVERLIGAPSSE